MKPRSVFQDRWLLAALAVLLGLAWQAVIVHSRHGGNWTALYYSGARFNLPPELESSTYRHPDSFGYDGQFYRLAAHDPMGLKGYSSYFDAPSYRRRRIAVPALAWLLGFGQTRLIDYSYLAVIHLMVAAGVVLLSRLADSYGRHPAWGLAFLLYPGTLNGIARLLPDLALGVVICGFLLWRQERRLWTWVLLAFGCLTRELGLLLVAAAVGQELWRRRWVFGAIWASAALPAIAWWWSIRPGDGTGGGSGSYGWLGGHAFVGFFERMGMTVHYSTFRLAELTLQAADVAVMAGLAAGAVAAVWCWWRERGGGLEWLALAGASLALVATNPYFLCDDYSYPRAFGLLVGPLALMALKERNLWLAVPLGLLALRLVLVMLGLIGIGLFG